MDYKKIVNKLTPKDNSIKNLFVSFISGGIVGIISYSIDDLFGSDAMLIFWIVIASLLTGIGVFDDFIDKFKMGLIIPITGFSHSVTSSTMEYKKEGLITGIGANYFKLAGSVILYGIVSATILYFIKEGLMCI